ncbi:MAG: GTPase HflX [Legionellales bacterium]|nr:GTPase HflX [Legionellales bacterium]OUX67506.1 MAG: GTPase HflX [bacterium TMED178]
MTKILVIHVQDHSNITHDPFEFYELINSQEFAVFCSCRSVIRVQNSKRYFAKGFYDWLFDFVKIHDIRRILINTDISARHQSELERSLCLSIIDRTQLILMLFQSRARSYEGKLQVELAHLAYLSTRLVRGWTHLERQRGGIGIRGGPGETQLELDKRILNDNIKRIKIKLARFNTHRQLNQRSREHVYKVNLVGYSNAGKSTLFEMLTKKQTYHDDRLFATLDPISARIQYRDNKLIVTDTVGFISNLPETLMQAFLSTISEIKLSNQLLHIVDISNPLWKSHIKTVNDYLQQLDPELCKRVKLVFNQCDRVSKMYIDELSLMYPNAFFISALKSNEVKVLFDYLINQIDLS